MHHLRSTNIFTSDKNGEKFNEKVLQIDSICLDGSTRPGSMHTCCQTSHFWNGPRVSHSKFIKILGRFLKRTKDKGTILFKHKWFLWSLD